MNSSRIKYELISYVYELNKGGSERYYDYFNLMPDVSSDSFTKNLT